MVLIRHVSLFVHLSIPLLRSPSSVTISRGGILVSFALLLTRLFPEVEFSSYAWIEFVCYGLYNLLWLKFRKF